MHLSLRDKESVIVFQKDLDLLQNWANICAMSFKTTKCFLITFGNSNGKETANSRYYLGRTELANVDSFNYLGLDQKKIDWGDLISARCSETLQTLGLLRHTIPTAPEKVHIGHCVGRN